MTVSTPKQLVRAYKRYGSLKAVAREEGMSWNRVHRLYVRAVEQDLMDPIRPGRKHRAETKPTTDKIQGSPKPQPTGRVRPLRTPGFDLPSEGRVRRYLFTSAQNDTKLHGKLWDNLQVLMDYYEGDIYVARFTYVKQGLGSRGDKARVLERDESSLGTKMWWDERLEPHFLDERAQVAPGLVWCGEMNILPTAVRPLSGLEVYTGRASGIFPHAKISMHSIASTKHEPPKFNYTTGTVTMRNYIERKAGLKADFHHCYGGLLVEVNSAGDWWCRQINSDNQGNLYDLDVRVRDGVVTTGNRVDSIYWADGHQDEANEAYVADAFDPGGVKDYLQPFADFIGDVTSVRGPASHHERKDPHTLFVRHKQGAYVLRDQIVGAGRFLQRMRRDWCRTHAIEGNHERHMGGWLRDVRGDWDPPNAELWLAMKTELYRRMAVGEPVHHLEMALGIVAPELAKGIRFPIEDESIIRCPDAHGGIECGSHGDRGSRGAKGSVRGFARLGRKRNIGDKHSAEIFEGVYVAGAFSDDETTDWTHGPSDWSCSHIVDYQNGKRAIITHWNGACWASREGLREIKE